MNTRLKEAARETAVLLGMWAVAACGLMFIAQRDSAPQVVFTPAPMSPNGPQAGPILPASWRPDGATMLAQAKAAHRVYAPQSQVASHQSLQRVPWEHLAKSSNSAWGATYSLAMIGSSTRLYGPVTRVFVYPGNTATCLNFVSDYRRSVVAVIKPANYRKFPNLQELVGKGVSFEGTLRAYRDPAAPNGWRPEIELTSPSQLQIAE